MLEEKVREVFADMVVLKDPQRSEYFSNLSIPSYMRDWLVMKFSDDEGVIDYEMFQTLVNANNHCVSNTMRTSVSISRR